MPLLTIEQCRQQCRADGEHDDALLGDLLASAEDAAAAYLNRSLYADPEGLDAALDSLPDGAANASQSYETAAVEAAAEADTAKAAAILSVAESRMGAWQLQAGRIMAGIVANGSILAAIRLTLGHLYANREDVVTGVSVAELPQGAKALLRPYRRVMGP